MTLVMVGGDGIMILVERFGLLNCFFFLVNFIMNNLATKHDMTKLITPFHSESTAHSNDVNISYC